MTPERIAELRDTAIRLSPVSWLGVGADYHEMLDEIERLRGLVVQAHMLLNEYGETYPCCSCFRWSGQPHDPETRSAHAAHVRQILNGPSRTTCDQCLGSGGSVWLEPDGQPNGAKCEACDGFGAR